MVGPISDSIIQEYRQEDIELRPACLTQKIPCLRKRKRIIKFEFTNIFELQPRNKSLVTSIVFINKAIESPIISV